MSGGVARRFFGEYGKHTKYHIARFLTGYFPPLANRLPPPRKKWKPEDRRMSIFDAAELAVAYLALRTNEPIQNLFVDVNHFAGSSGDAANATGRRSG
jgi:hypothetical protein